MFLQQWEKKRSHATWPRHGRKKKSERKSAPEGPAESWRQRSSQSPSSVWVSLQSQLVSFWKGHSGCDVLRGLKESNGKENAMGVTATKAHTWAGRLTQEQWTMVSWRECTGMGRWNGRGQEQSRRGLLGPWPPFAYRREKRRLGGQWYSQSEPFWIWIWDAHQKTSELLIRDKKSPTRLQAKRRHKHYQVYKPLPRVHNSH